MIESPTGVANVHEIARVQGVDVVIIGNNDLSSFSGFPQNDDHYQAMVTRIHDETLKAGKIWGQAAARLRQGPSAQQRCEVLPERPVQRRLGPAGSRRARRESERSAAR